MLKQTFAVTLLNLQTLGQRRGTASVAIIGIAGVVLVFVAVLSIGTGFKRTMAGTGADDTALVLRAGSDTELTSGLTYEQTRVVADAAGVARGADGPLASAEVFVIVNIDKLSTGTDANVPLRGVGPEAFRVRGNIEIVAGRTFQPGRYEIIAGQGAASQFAGLEVGNNLRLGQQDWKVVGIFSSGGTVSDSELWTDAKILQPAYRRGNSYQSVYTKLESAEGFDDFKDVLTADPRLDVRVVRESAYYEAQSGQLTVLITTVGGMIALLMGLGAIFGAINTMYTAVASRTREIATLRALGFGSLPVVVSVMAEALALALVGGLLGAGIAYAAVNGYQTATINWQTFSQVTFGLAVTPELLAVGIVYALFMGFLGGVLPAVKAALLPVATALREL